MLGSLSEADDAVQEAWQRLSRSDTHGVHPPESIMLDETGGAIEVDDSDRADAVITLPKTCGGVRRHPALSSRCGAS